MGLVGIFVALPIVLYGQFESADHQMRDLVTRAIQDRSKLIGHALAPVLRKVEPGTNVALNEELAKFTSDGTVLKLMLQPAAKPGEQQGNVAFYFVASAPLIRPDEVAPELDELAHRGILKKLGEACMWDTSDEIRYKQPNGTVELLTSIIPIKDRSGCWVLTSTHTTSEFLNTSIGRPYWETRAVRVAAAIYLVLAVLAVLAAVSIWLSLRRFRDVANEIGQGRIGDYAFSARNIVPELSSVAHDFDKLVIDLKRLSQQIRQSAEDNAHSFKTPLAAIQSSLAPVRRAVTMDDQRARRALEIIDSALATPARPGQRRPAVRQQHRRPDRSAARADQSDPDRRRGDAELPRNHGEPRHPVDPPARRCRHGARRQGYVGDRRFRTCSRTPPASRRAAALSC